MNQLETFLSWSILASEIGLCWFVFTRKVERILPFFAVYSVGLLTCTIGVWLTYDFFGIRSPISSYAYWGSVLLNSAMRSLAIAELCRYGLRAYKGIWALGWRLLAILSIFLLVHAGLDAWGAPDKLAIYGATIDRDLAFASIFILAALLLIRNYYGLALEPLQKGIAAGICFFCTVDAVGNAIIRNLYTGSLFSFFQTSQRSALAAPIRPQVERINDLWSAVHLLCFMFSIGIWCYFLRKPAPAASESPVLLEARVYRELSPAINLRLTTFNDRLVELLKP
jgi:hypothetical protein